MSRYIILILILLLLLLLLLIIIIINTSSTSERKIETGIHQEIKMILKSELNARNKITATGALTVPILRHSFGIINWRT